MASRTDQINRLKEMRAKRSGPGQTNPEKPMMSAEVPGLMSMEDPQAIYGIQQDALDAQALQEALQQQRYDEMQFDDAPIEPSMVQADTLLGGAGIARGVARGIGSAALSRVGPKVPGLTAQSGIDDLLMAADDVPASMLDDVTGSTLGGVDDLTGLGDDAWTAGADLVDDVALGVGDDAAARGGTLVLDDVIGAGADDVGTAVNKGVGALRYQAPATQRALEEAYRRTLANPGNVEAAAEFVRLQRLMNLKNGGL